MGKLSEEDYDLAWYLHTSGVERRDIANILCISFQYAQDIVRVRAIKKMKKYMPFTTKFEFIAWSKQNTNKLIKSGEIIIKTYCEKCGVIGKRIECHHNDYGNPADVNFLCCSCHRKAHNGESMFTGKSRYQKLF